MSLTLRASANVETAEKYHIYMVETSRIAVTGLHDRNLDYFVQAVDRTVRDIK